MPGRLLSIFLSYQDFLALPPEEVGAVLMEVIPGVTQNGKFLLEQLLEQFYPHDSVGGG